MPGRPTDVVATSLAPGQLRVGFRTEPTYLGAGDYAIYADGVLLATVVDGTEADHAIPAGTYDVLVRARDDNGTEFTQSVTVSATVA